MEKPNAATDLDIYFVGCASMLNGLSSASDIVEREAQHVGLTLDGELNGKRASNFLDLDDVSGHTAREEFNLLVLPFQSAFGNVVAARRTILKAVITHPDKQQVWDEMAFYHAQSLSLHHGSWSPAFSDVILQRYYPEKVAKFELPATPEEALTALFTK